MKCYRLSRWAAAFHALALSWMLVAGPGQAADGPFALQFDGVDDYVQVAHSTLINGYHLTVTAWIKTTQSSGEPGLVNKYLVGSLNGWNLFLFNGAVRAWYFRDSANFVWDGARGLNGGFVADGLWHHVAFVVDSTGASLYVDGVERAARGWTGMFGSATTTQEVRLGSYPGSGFYNGLLDEVTVWSRALTGTEISATRSNSLIGTESQLRGYWRLTEGAGNTAINSGFGPFFNGTLVNGPTWVPGVVLKPGVMTLPPDAVTSGSGRLNGVASPGGTNTSAWFEWGPTMSYGNVTPPQALGGGGNEVAFDEFITGLTSDVTIHFRAVGSNALGTAFGANATFFPSSRNMTQERTDHTATLLPNGQVLVAGGYGVSIDSIGFPTNTAELFDPKTGLWTRTAPMITNHGLHTATLLLNGKVLVLDFLGAELYDPVTGTWERIRSPAGAHNVHTATLLQNGKVLVAGGIGNFPELYDPETGNWTPTGRLNTPRDLHTATLLHNGKVLVTGGETGIQTVVASAELYDPVTGTWTNTGPMNVPRVVHSATLLINGQVLVVGGTDGTNYLASSERYNPITGTWIRVGEPLVHARGYHSATLLPRGAVVIVGGYPEPGPSEIAEVLEMNSDVWRAAAVQPHAHHLGHTGTLMPGGKLLLAGGGYLADVELYDPHEGRWINAPQLSIARESHTSTLLTNGNVLVAGLGNSEIYSATSNGFAMGLPMNAPRSGHTATLLANGTVLVAGGTTNFFQATATAELFNSTSGTWTHTGPLAAVRSGHSATLLANGQVLVAGGYPGGLFSLPIDTAEVYNPVSGLWTNTNPLTTRRIGHTATLLTNGKVLVAGGTPDNFSVLASAELYDLATGGWTPTTPMTTNRTGHKAILLPNGTVLVTGGSPNTLSLPHFSAEVFDPATATWKSTTPMIFKRHNPSGTLLPDGRVLVVGGIGEGYLSSAELYDPGTRSWALTDPKSTGTVSHAATLLPNGRVLVTGGWTGNGAVRHAELWDAGLAATPLWAPFITNRPASLVLGQQLTLGGLRFRGVSGASHGRDKDSPTDNPIVHLRNLEGERTVVLTSTNWSANTYASFPVTGLLPGWAMMTMYVNGIPSAPAALLQIHATAPTAPRLTHPIMLANGSFQFQFTNTIGALFAALATTNLTTPASNWIPLGLVTETSPGRFQFTDPQPATNTSRFHRVRSL